MVCSQARWEGAGGRGDGLPHDNEEREGGVEEDGGDEEGLPGLLELPEDRGGAAHHGGAPGAAGELERLTKAVLEITAKLSASPSLAAGDVSTGFGRATPEAGPPGGKPRLFSASAPASVKKKRGEEWEFGKVPVEGRGDMPQRSQVLTGGEGRQGATSLR